MTRAANPEATAVAHFLILRKLMERAKACIKDEKEKEKVGRPVRSRLREAPGLALSTGAAGLLTFYLSKSEEKLLRKLCEAFTRHAEVSNPQDAERVVGDVLGQQPNCNEEVERKIRDELLRGGSGYSVALSMMLSYLESLGLSRLCGGSVVAEAASFAKSLLEKPGLDSSVAQVLLPYLEAARRLVDAVVKGEE